MQTRQEKLKALKLEAQRIQRQIERLEVVKWDGDKMVGMDGDTFELGNRSQLRGGFDCEICESVSESQVCLWFDELCEFVDEIRARYGAKLDAPNTPR